MYSTRSIQETLASSKIQEVFLQSHICHVSIFGSYAKGIAHEDSDLDLLIELETGYDIVFETLDAIELLLQKELGVPSVDFVQNGRVPLGLALSIHKKLISIF